MAPCLSLIPFISTHALKSWHPPTSKHQPQRPSLKGSFGKELFKGRISTNYKKQSFCILGKWFCPNLQSNHLKKSKYTQQYKFQTTSSPPFFLRDSRASETPARVKITPREKRRHAAGIFLSPRRVSPFLVWGDFHARSSLPRSTIPKEKWGTTRSLYKFGYCQAC